MTIDRQTLKAANAEAYFYDLCKLGGSDSEIRKALTKMRAEKHLLKQLKGIQ